MQQYKDQITVNVDRVPAFSQPVTNLEVGSPAVGVTFTGKQPTALKTALVVGGICGLAGLSVGVVLGTNQQNSQLDRAKADLVQVQGDRTAIKREAEACLNRILGY